VPFSSRLEVKTTTLSERHRVMFRFHHIFWTVF
jgi:hypothetical protein